MMDARRKNKVLVISKTKRENLVSPIKRDRLKSAVTAVLKNLKVVGSENEILEPVHDVVLYVTLHKRLNLNFKALLNLPHPIFSKRSTEICVFTKDIIRQDYEKTIEYYEQRFRKIGLRVKVIPVESLKKNYRSTESKKLLGRSYSLYVVDTCLRQHVHKYLGKDFFCTSAAKRLHCIDLSHFNLRVYFKEVLNATLWHGFAAMRYSKVLVGPNRFSIDYLVDNLDACIKGVACSSVRGWENVRYLHIGSKKTLRYPLYVNEDVSEELNTLDIMEANHQHKSVLKRIEGDDLYSMKDHEIQLLLVKRLDELRKFDLQPAKKQKVEVGDEAEVEDVEEDPDEQLESTEWSMLGEDDDDDDEVDDDEDIGNQDE